MKKTNPQVRVLFSSGFGPDAAFQQILNAEDGACLIKKPFRFAELARQIADIPRAEIIPET